MLPFNIGPGELIIVLIIALIVIGPGKLPDVGSALGKSIREFRKAASDVKDATSLDAPRAAAPSAAGAATEAAPVAAVTSAPPVPAIPAATAAVAATAATAAAEPATSPAAGAEAAAAAATAEWPAEVTPVEEQQPSATG